MRCELSKIPCIRGIAEGTDGPLAQLAEQRTFNPRVVGSSPTGPTHHVCYFARGVTVRLRLMLDSVSADGLRLLRLIGDTPVMRELSVTEQRYQAVLAVIAEGETVTDVAARFEVSRKTVHAWLNKYEAGGVEGLGDGSHRPRSCPHQMPAPVEVALVQLRRAHPSWGPRRLVHELAKLEPGPVPQ
jgi:transposase-like protein